MPSLSPVELKAALDSPRPPLLIDVRSKLEWDKVRLSGVEVLHLPLPQLRKGLAQLPRDRELVTACWGGLRAYEAALIIQGAGLHKVSFLDGSLFTWPYGIEEEKGATWR